MGTSYGIDCAVSIVPTSAIPRESTPSGVPSLDEPIRGVETAIGRRFHDDLMAVTVSNAINRPFASFELVMAARPITPDGYTWADLIEPFSLVTIAMHRSGPTNDPTTTLQPETVLLGLVDYTAISEDFSDAAPRRQVRIVGRSLSALLADQRMWFHHFLANTQNVAHLPDVRALYQTQPNWMLLRDEVGLRGLGFLAFDVEMFKDVTQRHPIAAVAKAWDLFVTGTGQEAPFVQIQFADGAPLAKRLVWNAADAEASYVDAKARLQAQFIPTQAQMQQASCWDLLGMFCPQPFMEIYQDSIGTLELPECHVVLRKPPFAGHIGYDSGQPNVAFSTGAFPESQGSLFDSEYGQNWSRSRDTVVISGTDILAIPIMRRGMDGRPVYSAYDVQPALGGPSGNMQSDRLVQMEVAPIYDEYIYSPSYIRRVGIRSVAPRPNTISIVSPDGDTRLEFGDFGKHAYAYSGLAYTWFFRSPAFWQGQYVLKGNTGIRIGRRLVDRTRTRPREYYITSVVHRMEFGGQPSFTTTVQVERGWDLSPGAA